eukprot:TRINITY_DN1671_c0_g1_i1.p1 TRINITY_DN1671_c0_g1~~TRINITY_DN1671_c0_g1_i1.p1  ORF type:complete len:293 (-),score=35.64 TRINITY_DN1671_c0_g1_i1:87-965(-)
MERFPRNNRIQEFNLDLGYGGIGNSLISEYKIAENTGCCELGTLVSKLENVISISFMLERNDINSEGAAGLVRNFGKLNSLKALCLNLARNQISVQGAEALAFALGKVPNLTRLVLNLSEHRIGYGCAKYISQSLSYLVNLEYLDLNLWRNYIGYDGAACISDSLPELHNLAYLKLNLGHNSIGKEACDHIFNAISQLTNLQEIELRFHDSNFIDDQNAENIALCIRKLKNLHRIGITLAENEITSKGTEVISQAIKSFEKLDEVTFDLDLHLLKVDAFSEDKTTLVSYQRL